MLNGPPASGKSTIAARLVARRPLALNLDIDLIRSLLGSWKARPADAGVAARRLALAMAHDHLASGLDVIVPQFLAHVEFIDELARGADIVGARFVEIALMMDRPDAVAAFQRRSARPESTQHRDAAEAVAADGGTAALEAMYDTFIEMMRERTSALVVDVKVGDVDATAAQVEAAIDLNK